MCVLVDLYMKQQYRLRCVDCTLTVTQGILC